MPIAITDVHSIPAYANAGVTHIISIGSHDTNPPIPFPDLSRFKGDFTVHRIVFDDLSHLDPKGPTLSIMDRFLKILSDIPDDATVLFHCTAGRSRSPAAAFLYLVLKGATYEHAYAFLLQIRGFVQPNLLMIKLADQLLEREGKMVEYVTTVSGHVDWLQQQSQQSSSLSS